MKRDTMLKKALFLDRDGIINIDHGYVSQIDDFEFSDDIFDLLHLFTNAGYLLFIVTNQSGIGRKYYTHKDFETLTQWMIDILHEKHINIKEVQYCPHKPEDNCDCRKPATGMIDNILEKYSIDLSHSWIIGDKQSDIDLGLNANIQNSIAIGNKDILNCTYSFESILQCKEYLEENQGKIV